MKSFILGLFVLVIAPGISSCSKNPVSGTVVSKRVEVGPGPEDMVLDTLHSPRLLISCTARRESQKPYGEIEAVDLGTGIRTVLFRHGEPSGLRFRPHGICLDGALLYVISHETEPDYHPILIYRVHRDSLEFLELVHTQLLHSPNALVTGPRGEIYVVNDSGKRGSLAEKILRLRRASVVKLVKGADGEWESEFMALELGYPAGINRIGSKLYVGDAILHRIHVFQISNPGLAPVTQIRGLKGNDNIRIYNDMILTPGHIKPFRFISHTKDPGNLSPVEVFMVNPKTGEINSLFRTDGSMISGGSTAIIYDNVLYISQVFDPFILEVELDPSLSLVK